MLLNRVLVCVAGLAVGVANIWCSSTRAQQPIVLSSSPDWSQSPFSSTAIQIADPDWSQRGTEIDGSLRLPTFFAWAAAANPFEGSFGRRRLGDIDLYSGRINPSEVDLSLPAPGFSWVIGRTWNYQNAENVGGYQGRNWFQSSQPELQLGSDGQRIRIVYGADRFLEFANPVAGDSSGIGFEIVRKVWRGVNGVAGMIVKRTIPATETQSAVDVYEYVDQHGAKTSFFGFNSAVSQAKQGQLWKLADAAGYTAFVGDRDDVHLAMSTGYDAEGRILKAFDGASNSSPPEAIGNRQYSYHYSSLAIGGAHRLERVDVEDRGGENASWRLIAKVQYAYQPNGTSAPALGRPGDLIGTAVWTRCSGEDSNGAPVWMIARKHYRYAADGRLSYVFGEEGSRRWVFEKSNDPVAEWQPNPTAPLTVPTTLATAVPTGVPGGLETYAEAGYSYDGNGRVATAYFSGECACASGAGPGGVYSFTFEQRSGTPASAAEKAEKPWHRVVIKTPAKDERIESVAEADQEYATRVHYFNWLAQPLSSLTLQRTTTGSLSEFYEHPSTGVARKWWADAVVRRADGRVVSIHSTENIQSYRHTALANDPSSWGELQFKSDQGLVTLFDRMPATGGVFSSPEAEGFVFAIRTAEGNTPTTTHTVSSVEYETQRLRHQLAVGSTTFTVNRPYVAVSRTHKGDPAGDSGWEPSDLTVTNKIEGQTLTELTAHDTSAATVGGLVPTLSKLTAPVVSEENNGSGSNEVVSYNHFDLAGRLVQSMSVDGRLTQRQYDSLTGQLSTELYDAATANPISVAGVNFQTSASAGNPALEILTTTTYDMMGRVSTTTTPSASLGTRTSMVSYNRLYDHRAVVVGVPLVVTISGEPAETRFYGPFSVDVINHAGRTEMSATGGITLPNRKWYSVDSQSGYLEPMPNQALYATTDPSRWVSLNQNGDSVQLRVLKLFTGADLGSVGPGVQLQTRGANTNLYDATGTRLNESRTYFNQPLALTGGNFRHVAYDASFLKYDSAGRLQRIEDPTSTITEVRRDTLGRPISTSEGMYIPEAIPGVASAAGERMFQKSRMYYDIPGYGPMGTSSPSEVVTLTQAKLDEAPNSLVTSIKSDYRGTPFAVVGPKLGAEHVVTGLDYQGRPRAVGSFSIGINQSTGLPLITRETLLGGTTQQFARDFDLTAGSATSMIGSLSGQLGSLQRIAFDEMGRVFKVRQPNLVMNGNEVEEQSNVELVNQRWMDPVGRTTLVAGPTIEKTEYDRACRPQIVYRVAEMPAANGRVSYLHATSSGVPQGAAIVSQAAYIREPKSGAVRAVMNVEAWPDQSIRGGDCAQSGGINMHPIENPQQLLMIAPATAGEGIQHELSWPTLGQGSGLIGLPKAVWYDFDHLDRPVRSVQALMPEVLVSVSSQSSLSLPQAASTLALKRFEADPFIPSRRGANDGPEREQRTWWDDFGRVVGKIGPGLEAQITEPDIDGNEYDGSYLGITEIDPCSGELRKGPAKVTRVKKDAGRVTQTQEKLIGEIMLTPEEVKKWAYMDQILRGPRTPDPNDINLARKYANVPPGFDLEGRPLTGHRSYFDYEPSNYSERIAAIPAGGTEPPVKGRYLDNQGRSVEERDQRGIRREIDHKDIEAFERRALKISPPTEFNGPGSTPAPREIEYDFGPGERVRIRPPSGSPFGSGFAGGGLEFRGPHGFAGAGGTLFNPSSGVPTLPGNGEPHFPTNFPAERTLQMAWPARGGGGGSGIDGKLLPWSIRQERWELPGGFDLPHPTGTGLGGVPLNPKPAPLFMYPVPIRVCFDDPLMQDKLAGGLPIPSPTGSLDSKLGRTGMLAMWPMDSMSVSPPSSGVFAPPGDYVPTGSGIATRYGGYLGIDTLPWGDLPGPKMVNPGLDPYFAPPLPDLRGPTRPAEWPDFEPFNPSKRMILNRYYEQQEMSWLYNSESKSFYDKNSGGANTPGGGAMHAVHFEEWDRNRFTGAPRAISTTSFPQETMRLGTPCKDERFEKPVYWLCSTGAVAGGNTSGEGWEDEWAMLASSMAEMDPPPPPTLVAPVRESERFDFSDRGNLRRYERKRSYNQMSNGAELGAQNVLTIGGPTTISGGPNWGSLGAAHFSGEKPPTGSPLSNWTSENSGGDNRLMEKHTKRGDVPNQAVSNHTPLYNAWGLMLLDGERFRYRYDAMGRLEQVDRDMNQPYWGTPGNLQFENPARFKPFAKFTYDLLGRRTSAVYDLNGFNGDFRDELVEFFIYDSQWRVIATYRQAPAGRYAVDPNTPDMSKSDVRPTALLYERYVYHARGLDGATDIKGQDQPVLRQRFRYYGPRQPKDPVTGEEIPGEPVIEEVYAPGMGSANELTPQNSYTRVDQETVYYVQNLRGDVVSLASEEFVGEGENRQRVQGRILETVRYTAFGVPQVFRRLAADIADDQGTPLDHGQRTLANVGNSGVNDGDYNAFFAADGFFYQSNQGAAAIGASCDIADDAGEPLSNGMPVGGSSNSGVNEGDYNCFFNYFGDSRRVSTEQLYNSADPNSAGSTLYEYGELSFPENNNRIGYCGYWWDPHLQMYLVRNRWYTPREGRWLTPDPIGYAGGRNLYQYCENQPWLYTDPMGLATWFGNVLRGVGLDSFGDGVDEGWDLLTGKAQEEDANWEANMRKAYAKCMEQAKADAASGKICDSDVRCRCEHLRKNTDAAVTQLRNLRENEWNAVGDTIRSVSVALPTVLFAPATLLGQLAFGIGGNVLAELTYGGGDAYEAAKEGALSGLFGWGIGKVLKGVGGAFRSGSAKEIAEYMKRGFTESQAKYLAQPYKGMGHHFLPRRLGLPRWITESPLNIVSGRGMSRGEFYRRHYLADPSFHGARLPGSVGGGSWSGSMMGLTKPNAAQQLWYAAPNWLRNGAAGSATAGGGIGLAVGRNRQINNE
ncbi:MAG: RHS repeat-associated core domain-containing protein [Phycisphaerales bacterium]|nr:RHS repeat-associated core domain-containing protein [Phycisphaerales bacterium]